MEVAYIGNDSMRPYVAFDTAPRFAKKKTMEGPEENIEDESALGDGESHEEGQDQGEEESAGEDENLSDYFPDQLPDASDEHRMLATGPEEPHEAYAHIDGPAMRELKASVSISSEEPAELQALPVDLPSGYCEDNGKMEIPMGICRETVPAPPACKKAFVPAAGNPGTLALRRN